MRREALLMAAALLSCSAVIAQVRALFDPASPEIGPFPSDALTVPDARQKTGLRMNLPLPDCQAAPAACSEFRAINALDGFDLQPRIRLSFSGAIDAHTLRLGVFLVPLENLSHEEFGINSEGSPVAINQVTYDTTTATAWAKPDEMLDQHRRYALVVTDAVRDAVGKPIAPDPRYTECLRTGEGHCATIAETHGKLLPLFKERHIVSHTVFTTMSATVFLERARDSLDGAPPAASLVAPRGIFNVRDLASITLRRQTRRDPVQFSDAQISLALLDGVGRMAFGTFQSPLFLNEQLVIDDPPTAEPVTTPAKRSVIAFHVYLPDSAPPDSGYPVVIAGHGLGGERFGFSTAIASVMAKNGFAVAAINAFGHGYGADGRLVIRERSGAVTELPLGGRAVDYNGDGAFGSSEGCNLPAETVPVGWGDCQRQTALDLLQFVRALKTDRRIEGLPSIDSSRIYYIGSSMGGIYGGVFAALDPELTAAVLNVAGGTGSDISRCQNPDGAYVLRHQPVKFIEDRPALEIQEWRDRHNWIEMRCDPVAYAPHYVASTLPGVRIRPVLFQVAKGDLSLPNPASSNLIRAARLEHMLSLYRHDLAREKIPALPENPHGYLTNRATPESTAIALAAQEQAAGFFRSPGWKPPDVNHLVRPIFGRDLFETPDQLPETIR